MIENDLCFHCHLKCGRGNIDFFKKQRFIDRFYEYFCTSKTTSLLKKHLTPAIFENCRDLHTPFGATLLEVIRSGVINWDSGVGLYAPDPYAYTVFSDLFDPVIEEYHMGFKPTDKHPAEDWGVPRYLGNVDPSGQHVISTRVRCGRGIKGYPFGPMLTHDHYIEMEKKIVGVLKTLTGEFKGKYYDLLHMSWNEQQQMIDEHILFKSGDRFLVAAKATRFWPEGRGFFINEDKTFLVWVNEEDHLRIISMQPGGDLAVVFRRLKRAVVEIGKSLEFTRHKRLGFLTFCPTNIGTTIRASVHIKLPRLAAEGTKLQEIADKYNLQVRGTTGEHTESVGNVYDVSNKRRIGITEFDVVKEMADGIRALIVEEEALPPIPEPEVVEAPPPPEPPKPKKKKGKKKKKKGKKDKKKKKGKKGKKGKKAKKGKKGKKGKGKKKGKKGKKK